MNKLIILLLDLLIIVSLVYGKTLKGLKVDQFPFYVYTEKDSRLNNYFPSGFMGDIEDISISYNWLYNTKRGVSCIKISYKADWCRGAGWAGIYWQNPAKNWGGKRGGYNLTNARRLFFYARGHDGHEIVEFKFGGIKGDYPDTATETLGEVELTKTWKRYMIELKGFDLSHINGGFCISISGPNNPDGAVIYLDEIYYSDSLFPVEKKYVLGKYVDHYPFYVYTEYQSQKNHFYNPSITGETRKIKINNKYADNVRSGQTCIQIQYQVNNNKKENNYTGIIWQETKNNFGQKKEGFDLTGAKKLIFYARGEKGGEIVEFSFGGITGKFSDSTGISTGLVKLRREWKKYEIDLYQVNLSYISAGFVVKLCDENSENCTLYLDEIYFED